jgi:hypothetical protein
MLIDLLATDNLTSYNTKVARVLGLHTAVYIAELMNISAKASQKAKLVEDKYFILDRKYITKRTTLEFEEQFAIDSKLMQLNIIQKPAGDVDTIYFDVNKLAEILSTDDEQTLAKVAKKAKVTTTSVPGVRQSARKKQFDDLKQYITVGNEELKQAFEDWIDGVYNNPKGFLSKKAVSLFQRDVDTFANGDLDVALKVLEIATVGGYREASWAIEKFNKDYANQFRRRYVVPTTSPIRNVVVSDEVF